MAAFSRLTPEGWIQGDDSSAVSRLTPTGWEQVTATGGGGTTGTWASQLDSIATSWSGSVNVNATGTWSGTLDSVTGAWSGAALVTGTWAGTLASVTGTWTGSLGSNVTGTWSGTLADVAGSWTGTALVTGTWAGTLDAVTGAWNGAIGNVVTGAWSSQLAGITGAWDGTVSGAAGTWSSQLASVTGAWNGTALVTGTWSGTLEAFTGTWTGAVALNVTGTWASQLASVTGSWNGTIAQEVTGEWSSSLDDVLGLWEDSGGEIGGSLVRRRRRYGVRNRIYEAEPEELVEIAEAAKVPLEEVKEITTSPERNRNGTGKPRNRDDFGYEFWYPHEMWGRSTKGWEDKFTAPLGDDFYRALAALKQAESRRKQPRTIAQITEMSVAMSNQQAILLLLLT